MTNIRQIEAKDLDEVFKVLKESWFSTYVNEKSGITKEIIEEYFSLGSYERLAENIKKSSEKENFCFLAEENSEVVGFVMGKFFEEKVHIYSIYILDNFQTKGIGTKLMNKVFEISENFEKITLQNSVENSKSMKFYKKLGFEIIPGSENYYNVSSKQIPVISMQKIISKN